MNCRTDSKENYKWDLWEVKGKEKAVYHSFADNFKDSCNLTVYQVEPTSLKKIELGEIKNWYREELARRLEPMALLLPLATEINKCLISVQASFNIIP